MTRSEGLWYAVLPNEELMDITIHTQKVKNGMGFKPWYLQTTFDSGLSKVTNIPSLNLPFMCLDSQGVL